MVINGQSPSVVLTFLIISAIIHTQRRAFTGSSRKDGLAEVPLGPLVQQLGRIMTQSIIEYRATMERRLEKALSKISSLNDQQLVKMQHNDVDLGFAKNGDTYSVLRIAKGSFHLVSADDQMLIVLYVTHCETGFALYNEDREAFLPVDIHEVVATWLDESTHFQHNMLALLYGNVREVIDHSTPTR